MCKASIIIPAYNAGNYIEQTIQSILMQDFADFEVIVIDDGSTDTTASKVKILAGLDHRIKYVHQKNSGAPATPRNVGISIAKGDYLFIFDSDDLMSPGKMKKSIDVLDIEKDVDFLCTNFSSIDESGSLIKENYLEEYETLWELCKKSKNKNGYYVLPATDLYPSLLKVNFVGTSSVVFRRTALNGYSFDESLSNADDYLLWVSFLKNRDAIFISEVLHFYRIIKTGISGRSYLKRGPSRIKALQKIKNIIDDKRHIRIISKKLSNEYCAMSYAFKKEKDKVNQRKFAIKSIGERINVKAIKLYAVSFF